MNGQQCKKVTASHLAREACVYVRQAAPRETVENDETLRQQYNLRHVATALGWPAERVMVIDSDVGQSGLCHTRPGFRKLLQQIGRRRVGIVIALESSRLTRNTNAWRQLIDVCALNDTLVLSQGQLFDPGSLCDRVYLGGHETIPSTCAQQKESLV